MITPTIGRKVWFFPCGFHTEMNVIDYDQPLDGTVVFIHAGGKVNLDVTDQLGHRHFVQCVPLTDPADGNRAPDAHAEWMPYQAAQAKS